MSKNLRFIASRLRHTERRRRNRSGVFTFCVRGVDYGAIDIKFPDQDAVDNAVYELASIVDSSFDELMHNDPKAFWDYFCSLLSDYGTITITNTKNKK